MPYYSSTPAFIQIAMPQDQILSNADKKWLDRIVEDGVIKCYTENEILEQTFVGHGGFGIVYKARMKHSGITVAMKTLSLGAYTSEEELYRKFTKEVSRLYTLTLITCLVSLLNSYS